MSHHYCWRRFVYFGLDIIKTYWFVWVGTQVQSWGRFVMLRCSRGYRWRYRLQQNIMFSLNSICDHSYFTVSVTQKKKDKIRVKRQRRRLPLYPSLGSFCWCTSPFDSRTGTLEEPASFCLSSKNPLYFSLVPYIGPLRKIQSVPAQTVKTDGYRELIQMCVASTSLQYMFTS